MDVLGIRRPTLYGTSYKQPVYDQHDAEYIVPAHYRSDFQLYNRNNNNWLPPYRGHDSYHFPSSQLRHNIWLDQKSHDRIQNWLSDHHEYTGYRPPEEESIASIRSNSAVDVLRNERSPVEENLHSRYLPKYKSEERIQSLHPDSDENRRTGFKRYNSPDCIRRRYYSPRSDPTLNIPKPPQNINCKHLSPLAGSNETNYRERSMNRTFYQSGKGNTFPRRNKYIPNRGIPRHLINESREVMGQQMGKYEPLSYEERVMLNPYASGNSNNNIHEEESANSRQDKQESNETQQQSESPLLVGRTFVLNGISLQAKQGNHVATNTDDKNSSVAGNMSQQTSPHHDSMLSTTDQNNSNEAIVSITNEKTDRSESSPNEKSESVSSIESELPKPVVHRSFHVRVASAPATTDSNKLDRDIYWRGENSNRRHVPYEIRKVKALSWPKRAVLPTRPDIKFIEDVTRSRFVTQNMQDVQDELNELDYVNVTVNDIHDRESDQSDIPPARPPLPADHKFPKRENSISEVSGHERLSVRASNASSLPNNKREKVPSTVEEELIVQAKNISENFNELTPGIEHHYLSDHYTSNSSLLSDHYRCDLSKSVSMSLKDLIRIHEQEIARVSRGVSTRTLDKIDETTTRQRSRRRARRSSLDRYKDRHSSKWKRHTTIGLLSNYAEEKGNNSVGSPSSPENENDVISSFEHVAGIDQEERNSPTSTFNLQIDTTKTRLLSTSVSEPPPSPSTERSNQSPPSTLPKPKRSTTVRSQVTPTITTTTTAAPADDEANWYTDKTPEYAKTSESAVQTDQEFVRSLSFRKNVARIQELTFENEMIKKDFELEREELIRKLQEQKKVANAYQKLEDRYRRKVYDLQKAMKMCTCSPNRMRVYSGEGDHYSYRPGNSSMGDPNEMSVQKVDGILHKLETWLNQHTYPESDISSIFDSNAAEELYQRNKRSGGIDRIIDGIDATSV